MYSDNIENSLLASTFGGRPGISTGDALLSQKMLLDLAMYRQTPTTLISLYASKCFNRVFPIGENIALQHLGAPPNLGIVMTEVLCNMSHRVRTAYGLSPDSISPQKNEMWTGIGQGSGASCPSWLGQQTIMVTAIEKITPFPITSDPTNQIQTPQRPIGFVDDTNLILTHEGKEKSEIEAYINKLYNT